MRTGLSIYQSDPDDWPSESELIAEHETANLCQWYALCTNSAAGEVKHPVLGHVPTCTRCAAKHDLVFES